MACNSQDVSIEEPIYELEGQAIGPNVVELRVDGDLVYGRTAVSSWSYSREGFFILDTSAHEALWPLSEDEWRQALERRTGRTHVSLQPAAAVYRERLPLTRQLAQEAVDEYVSRYDEAPIEIVNTPSGVARIVPRDQAESAE